jgi:hypothetical protein
MHRDVVERKVSISGINSFGINSFGNLKLALHLSDWLHKLPSHWPSCKQLASASMSGTSPSKDFVWQLETIVSEQ